jgi:DNA modification methylase
LSRRPKTSKPKTSSPFNHLRSLQVEYRDIRDLRPSPHNARTHSDRQIRQIERSIEQFGFTNPALVDEANVIMAGHGRVKAAERRGLSRVPVIRIENLSDAQKRAYIIADNELATKAGWDKEILAIELQGLIDLKFDLELTGFEGSEIDIILGDQAGAARKDDIVPEIVSGTAVTKAGDVWQLDEHLLICGDARDPSVYARMMSKAKARMVVADPPYNLHLPGNVSGHGRNQHQNFRMASGELSPGLFKEFLRAAFMCMAASVVDGAILHVFMDWRHMAEVLDAGNSVFSELKNLCVWVKSNGGLGSFYRSRHELVFVWKHGRKPHVNNIDLGRHGRSRTNVWEYDGMNVFREGRQQELVMHPTCKPVDLIADAIKDCSRRDDLILDPFAGSGTTIIACQKTGRRARLIEIEPRYCDVIIRRWQDYSGGVAVHVGTGLSFAEAAPSRSSRKHGHERRSKKG